MTLRRTHRRFLVPLALALLLGGFVLPAPAAYAATTRHVTDCGDAGANTLRGQIGAAQAGDTIVFDRDCAGATAIVLTTGTLTLARKVTIDGSGHTVVVDGGCTLSSGVCTSGGETVFTVNGMVMANLTALTIQHGNAANGFGAGGGIYDDSGTLTVTNSTFSGNSANQGGGISNLSGTLTVTNSTFSGNTAPGSAGGGILNASGGTVTVTTSTFTGNSATFGGGIDNISGGTVTVTTSTFSGNSAAEGGGIFNGSTLTVTNSTITGNSATPAREGTGGGIYSPSGGLTMTNTIVAGNIAFEYPDVSATITSNGHNLFGNTNGGSGYVASDLRNVNPRLGTLGDNGGPTQTIPLLQGSPAIDAGDDAVCAAPPVSGVDQRGTVRPVGAHCDIGAFETGVINAVPAPKPPGPAGGPGNTLPVVRPAGSSGGAPNPLPAPRP